MVALLAVQIEGNGTTVVCHLAGEVDMATCTRLREALIELEAQRRVILDFAEVSLIDSAGLACLIAAVRRVHAAGGAIVVSSARGVVGRVFRTVGMPGVVPLAETIDQATALLDAAEEDRTASTLIGARHP